MGHQKQLKCVRLPKVFPHQKTAVKLFHGLIELEQFGLVLLFEEPAEHSDYEIQYNIFVEGLFYEMKFWGCGFEKEPALQKLYFVVVIHPSR